MWILCIYFINRKKVAGMFMGVFWVYNSHCLRWYLHTYSIEWLPSQFKRYLQARTLQVHVDCNYTIVAIVATLNWQLYFTLVFVLSYSPLL